MYQKAHTGFVRREQKQAFFDRRIWKEKWQPDVLCSVGRKTPHNPIDWFQHYIRKAQFQIEIHSRNEDFTGLILISSHCIPRYYYVWMIYLTLFVHNMLNSWVSPNRDYWRHGKNKANKILFPPLQMGIDRKNFNNRTNTSASYIFSFVYHSLQISPRIQPNKAHLHVKSRTEFQYTHMLHKRRPS